MTRARFALAALVALTGALCWCVAAYFFRRPAAIRADEGISPLGRLILFGAVGTLLVAAGTYGLWRSFRGPTGRSAGGHR